MAEPPPPVTLNETGIPGSGLPSASRTRTAGGVATGVPTTADSPPPAADSIEAGAPTPTPTRAVAEAKPSAAKIRVRVAGEPRMARSVKATRPCGSLVALVVPSSVPPPAEIWTVTTTSPRAMSPPDASCSWTTGWGSKAVPETAVAGGSTVKESRAATPVVVNTTG